MNTYSHLPFNKYGNNVYSQNGEDGILAFILDCLSIENEGSWCVEFGAWDGKHLSNTFNLVTKGWNSVYIEGDSQKFNDLLETTKSYPKIIPLLAFVESNIDAQNSLNNLLSKTPLPNDFELLSIDVDSIDLDIWESLEIYKPKIVIIEINSSVLPGILWRHTLVTPGNSFSSTISVAKHKKYTLVCHTGNLIFIRDDLLSSLTVDDRFIKYPELLFINDWIKPRV